MKRTVLLLMLLLIISSPAWCEDIVAIFKDKKSNSMELSYRDDTHVRMKMANQGYMLVTKDKVYMVTGQEGQWQAIDMDQMAGMMKAFGQGASEAITEEVKSGQGKLKDSGRTEMVAGYKGKIYLVEEEQEDGSIKNVEMVLSSHADLKRINQAWIAISTRLGSLFGQELAQSIKQTIDESQQKDYGGLLRYGDMLVLSSISKKKLEDSYFELPENVTLSQMPQFSLGADTDTANMDETAEPEPSDRPESHQDKGGVLKEELNKGMRKLFKKLF